MAGVLAALPSLFRSPGPLGGVKHLFWVRPSAPGVVWASSTSYRACCPPSLASHHPPTHAHTYTSTYVRTAALPRVPPTYHPTRTPNHRPQHLPLSTIKSLGAQLPDACCLTKTLRCAVVPCRLGVRMGRWPLNAGTTERPVVWQLSTISTYGDAGGLIILHEFFPDGNKTVQFNARHAKKWM